MTMSCYRAVACALVVFASAVVEAAVPVALDTEQKSASAVVAAHSLYTDVLRDMDTMTYEARRSVVKTLSELHQLTTPEALMASPGGVNLPCASGGSFTAKMAATYPRVLKIEWLNCTQSRDEFATLVVNGPVEVRLLSDTFVPEVIAGLRVGCSSRDATWVAEFFYPDEPLQTQTRTYNYTMTGTIPTTRLFEQGYFTGKFAYELNGFARDHSDTAGYPDQGTSFLKAERLVARGAVTYRNSNTVLERSVNLERGTFTSSRESAPAFPYPSSSFSYTAQGLQVREITDYADFSKVTNIFTIDGQVKYSRQGWGEGCVNGLYSFKTNVPVRNPALFSGSSYDSGEILINNSATVRFYSAATVPPSLPTPTSRMLTSLDIHDVGVFNYDGDYLMSPQLLSVAQCTL